MPSKTKAPKDSPAIALIRHVYTHAQASTSHSYGRLNTALKSALHLAIGSGMEFHRGDFSRLSEFRWSYWRGEVEDLFSAAVSEGNDSAILAFEDYAQRGPIFADQVTPVSCRFAHSSGTRDKERLHVGASFFWKGEHVEVTSFKGEKVIACSYTRDVDMPYSRKIKRRYRIDREDIIADRADRKRRDEIMKELRQISDSENSIEYINKQLAVRGLESKAKWATASLRSLEAFLASMRLELSPTTDGNEKKKATRSLKAAKTPGASL